MPVALKPTLRLWQRVIPVNIDDHIIAQQFLDAGRGVGIHRFQPVKAAFPNGMREQVLVGVR